jgi:hypothetical protein
MPVPPAGGGQMPMASNNKNIRTAEYVIASASWDEDPEIFTVISEEGFNKKTAKILPGGMICPSCSSREAHYYGDKTFCYACDKEITNIIEESPNPQKIRFTTVWM